MANKNRATLKGFFETGKIPTQQNYQDLINSTLNLEENTDPIGITSITASSNISASGKIITDELSEGNSPTGLTITGNVTASGNISSSETISGSFIHGATTVYGGFLQSVGGVQLAGANYISFGSPGIYDDRLFDIFGENYVIKFRSSSYSLLEFDSANGDISASGAISCSETIHTDQFRSNNVTILQHLEGISYINHGLYPAIIQGTNITLNAPITASGNISCSGTVIADKFESTGGDDQITFVDNLFVDGNITSSGVIKSSGSGNNASYLSGGNIIATGFLQVDGITTLGDASTDTLNVTGQTSFTGDISASNNITASGTIKANEYVVQGLNALKATGTGLEIGNDGTIGSISYGAEVSDIHQFFGNVKIGALGVVSHMTASGNISASGELQSQLLRLTAGADNYVRYENNSVAIKSTDTSISLIGNVTASENISASGTIIASEANIKGNITASGVIDAGTSARIGFGGYLLGRGNSLGTSNVAYIQNGGTITTRWGDTSVPNIWQGEKQTFTSETLYSFKSEDGIMRFTSDATNGSQGINFDVDTTNGHIGFGKSGSIDASNLKLTNLPTSDPEDAGRVWVSGSTAGSDGSKFLVVSQG